MTMTEKKEEDDEDKDDRRFDETGRRSREVGPLREKWGRGE